MKNNLKHTTMALVGLFVVHYIFSLLDLYWIYKWLDNVMHFTAGAIISLFILRCFEIRKVVGWSLDGSIRRVSMVLLVAFIALSWEYFERRLGLAKPFDGTLYDTQMDVWATICGSFVGYTYIYFKKK